jgi:hypothetical protein
MSLVIPTLPVYGVCGLKGQGKDTIARLIQKANSGFTITHFAQPLKSMTMAIFGLSYSQLYDDKEKEIPLEKEIVMDEYLEAMKAATGLDIKPEGVVAKTPRQVLQLFGTDYVRKAEDLYWVTAFQGVVKACLTRNSPVIVPDLRFLNEEKAIRDLPGGYIVRVLRIDFPESSDLHPSEMEGLKINPDLLIGAKTGDLSLPRRIAGLLAHNQLEEASWYDFRLVQKVLKMLSEGSDVEGIVCTLYKGDEKTYCVVGRIMAYYGNWK